MSFCEEEFASECLLRLTKAERQSTAKAIYKVICVFFISVRLVAGTCACRHYEAYPLDTCLNFGAYSVRYACVDHSPVQLWYNNSICTGEEYLNDADAEYRDGMGFECNESLPICNSTDVKVTWHNSTDCSEKGGEYTLKIVTDLCVSRENATEAYWYSCDGREFRIRVSESQGSGLCNDLSTMQLDYDGNGCFENRSFECFQASQQSHSQSLDFWKNRLILAALSVGILTMCCVTCVCYGRYRYRRFRRKFPHEFLALRWRIKQKLGLNKEREVGCRGYDYSDH